MADYTRAEKPGNTYRYTWLLTTADDTGAGVEVPGAPDKAWQAFGTFGGGTLKWEGSLDDGTTWFQLHDPTNVAIGVTAAAGGAILECPLRIRPTLTGSTAGSVTAILSARSAK